MNPPADPLRPEEPSPRKPTNGLGRSVHVEGDLIDDFCLIRKVGVGAFAQVFLARQISMQRLVALKISAERSNEPETLAQLDHPNIVRVFDQRFCESHQVWLLYMQFAPGGTLREVIEKVQRTPASNRDGKILIDSVDRALNEWGYPPIDSERLRRYLTASSWAEVVCHIGIQLANALKYSHQRDILHRDVKPANVLLTHDCVAKLADFNCSSASSLQNNEAESFLGGSLGYMSPEQIDALNPEVATNSNSLDGRADLYSLSALLWELLYGERPFRENGLSSNRTRMLAQLAENRRNAQPSPPFEDKDRIRISLTKVLLTGLKPDRNDRPIDGALFARELWLCMKPQSRALLQIHCSGWRSIVRHHPMFMSVLVVLIPNGLAGFFNYTYNRSQIVLKGDDALNAFQQVSTVLNILYFSLGAIIANWVVGPVASSVSATTKFPSIDSQKLEAIRIQSLRLGSVSSIIGVALWVSSGVVFPLSLQWMVPHVTFDYTHFIASMTICGLIAAAYPYFGLTFLVSRVFYPALLKDAAGTERDAGKLEELEDQLSVPLFIAAIVPMASLLVVSLLRIQSRYVSLSLILSGVVGLVVVYLLYCKIRKDIHALLVTIRISEEVASDTRSTTLRHSTVGHHKTFN
jgi:eukaryotic-like serine/threonine-protein kinase